MTHLAAVQTSVYLGENILGPTSFAGQLAIVGEADLGRARLWCVYQEKWLLIVTESSQPESYFPIFENILMTLIDTNVT